MNLLKSKTVVFWKILSRKEKSQSRIKLFTIHLPDKKLVSKIYEELLKPRNKAAIKNDKIFHRPLTKEDIWKSDNHLQNAQHH